MTIVKAWTDGGGNTGTPCSCACVLELGDGTFVERAQPLPNVTTNNVAEYMGVMLAVDTAQALGLKQLQVRSDSQLIVNQLNGGWKCKDAGLAALREAVLTLVQVASMRFTIEWVPREQNKRADKLCREVLRAGREFSRVV